MNTKRVCSLAMACMAIAAIVALWPAAASAQVQDGSKKAAPAGAAKAESASKADASASTGDAAIIAKQKPTYPLDTCVVSGEKLGKEGEPFDYVYKGRLVRFCCQSCTAAFEKEPAKYVAKIDAALKKGGMPQSAARAAATNGKEAPAKTAAPEATKQPNKLTYTCPMHPEIHESKPGKCAKCGMNLVKAS